MRVRRVVAMSGFGEEDDNIGLHVLDCILDILVFTLPWAQSAARILTDTAALCYMIASLRDPRTP